MQVKMDNKNVIDVRDYYNRLCRKDKGKFLRCLTAKFDYPASTMSAKLSMNSQLRIRKDEMINITNIIKLKLWEKEE